MDQLKQAIAALLPGQKLKITISIVESTEVVAVSHSKIVERLCYLLNHHKGVCTVRDLERRHSFTKKDIRAAIAEAPETFEEETLYKANSGRPSTIIRLIA